MLENNVAIVDMSRPGRRGKSRLRALSKLDGRSAAAKKAQRLVQLWGEALNDVSPVQAMALQHAAACVVIAEDAQARMLSGDTSVTPADVVKLANVAQRAVKQLNLPEAKPSARRNGLKRLEWRR